MFYILGLKSVTPKWNEGLRNWEWERLSFGHGYQQSCWPLLNCFVAYEQWVSCLFPNPDDWKFILQKISIWLHKITLFLAEEISSINAHIFNFLFLSVRLSHKLRQNTTKTPNPMFLMFREHNEILLYISRIVLYFFWVKQYFLKMPRVMK